MADYWKSYDKKYCDICKCWLSGNKASIEFHENGKSHQANVQKRLREIQKKTRTQEKDEKKMNKSLDKIMKAAEEAYNKDKEANPGLDISLKLKAYEDHLAEQKKEASVPSGSESAKESEDSKSKKPKILHRDEKKVKKEQEVMEKLQKPPPTYTSKGGWKPLSTSTLRMDLELPSQEAPREEGPSKKKSKYDFEEKTVTKMSTSGFVKSEPVETVGFKKRKFNASNMRKRDD